MQKHKDRVHSKFSASGSERWLNCAYSVALEEQAPPQAENHFAKEGTFAHEVLEKRLNGLWPEDDFLLTDEMLGHIEKVVNRVRLIAAKSNAPLLVEKKVFNSDIHEEMFGTCDIIIPQVGGTLHIIDFKYGAGHIVNPVKNTQLIQYSLGVAESYDWQFKEAQHHIMQPRAGKDWHKAWGLSIHELRHTYRPLWIKGVERVEGGRSKPFEGSWCHWCQGRATNPATGEAYCPAKRVKSAQRVSNVFKNSPLESEIPNGKESKKEEKSDKIGKKGKTKSPFKKESEGSEDFF